MAYEFEFELEDESKKSKEQEEVWNPSTGSSAEIGGELVSASDWDCRRGKSCLTARKALDE